MPSPRMEAPKEAMEVMELSLVKPWVGVTIKEAVQLLKSLRPSVKAFCTRSVNTTEANGRALLDGGATHVLRPARSKKEFEEAIPIKVELAAGSPPYDRWNQLAPSSRTLRPRR